MVVDRAARCCGHNLILLLKLILIYHSGQILTKLCSWVLLMLVGHVSACDLLPPAHLRLAGVLVHLAERVLRPISGEPRARAASRAAAPPASSHNHAIVDSLVEDLHCWVDLLVHHLAI